MLGGFVILLGLMLLKPERKPIKKIHQLSFIILPMLLIIMLLSGILLGNMDVYFDLFLNNQFVHIMTIDLFVLILTPYVLGYVHWPLLNYTKWFLP
jgi:hypothetical protein